VDAGRAVAVTPYYQDDLVTIYHGEAAEVMADLEPEWVDLVFTDPPYPAEFDDVWDDLASGAARLLKPGASVLTYLGHYQMPRVIDAMRDAGLRYHWVCVQRNNGAMPRMFGRRTMVAFKPILWFTKGAIRRGPLMSDELSYVPKGIRVRKAMHEWGQPLSYLPIVRLTEPGDLILDPFVGSGTVLVAAKDAGRRAIGIEMDERHCETAALRCQQAVLGLSA
jgi:site-specific DNA-methyltransferase (adenine-specific)